MNIDYEVRIGRVRVQTGCCDNASIGYSRQTISKIIVKHHSLLVAADVSLHVIRIGACRKLLGRDLDRFAVAGWKTVKTKFAALAEDPNENRKPGCCKARAA